MTVLIVLSMAPLHVLSAVVMVLSVRQRVDVSKLLYYIDAGFELLRVPFYIECADTMQKQQNARTPC